MATFDININVRDNNGAKNIQGQMERLNRTAQQTQRVISRIGRRVRVGGIKKARRETEKLGKSASNVRSIFGKLFAGIGIVFAIKKAAELSDAYTNVQNRLKLVTTGSADLADTTEKLFAIADRTRSAFEQTAELYTRVSIATRGLGKSTRDLQRFTEALNKSVILSGASAQEAKNGIIQLSQGLASGALRGDELRSVLEQLPDVADRISSSLKITRGELRAMGEAGKLSSEVIVDAMLKAAKAIDEDFAKTVPTIGQAFAQLNNQIIKGIGEFNKATGAANAFAQSIQFTAGHIKALVITLVAAGLAWATVALQAKFATFALFRAAVASKAAAAATHPVAAAFVAVAVATEFATSAIADYFDKVSDLERRELAKGALEQATDRFIKTKEAIIQLNKVVQQQGGTTDVLTRRLAMLNHNLRINVDSIKKANGETHDYTAEKVKLAAGTKLVVAKLKDETDALLNLDVARALGLATLKEVRRLEKTSGIKDTEGKAKLAIEDQLRLRDAADRYRTAVDSIKKPQADFIADLAALRLAYKNNEIGLSGMRIEMAKLVDIPAVDFGGAFGGQVLDARIDQLRERMSELTLSTQAQDEAMGQLIAAGIDGIPKLTDKVKALGDRLRGGEIDAGEYEAALRNIGELDEFSKLKDDLAELARLHDQGTISAEEHRAKIVALGIDGAKAATTFGEGFTRAFEKIEKEANDLAAVGEKLADLFVNKAADAITEFVTKGTLDFKEFATALLADLAKILVRLLIVKALSAAFGGTVAAPVSGAVANAATAATTQGRQEGGTVQPGRSFVVGENGPEILVPDRTGTIIPNAKDQQQAAPPNITVVNIIDPDEVNASLDSGENDQVIVNLISRNKDRINGALAT